MTEQEGLARQFEAHRSRLQAVAYRMLGSLSEADDAVQEAWLRLSRADCGGVGNLGSWLTTVVSRICLDMLRSRKSRREEPMEAYGIEPTAERAGGSDPEREALLADAVGNALLVVLGRLAPAERIAFVLHDIFAVPFTEIAPIVGRSEAAARQLASRARRRVQGAKTAPAADLARQRELVDAFLAAARAGDFAALVAVLDPDVVLRDDRGAGSAQVIGGAAAVAEQIAQTRAQGAQPALVNGSVGVIVASLGKLLLAIEFTIRNGKIAAFDLISDPARLRGVELAVLDG